MDSTKKRFSKASAILIAVCVAVAMAAVGIAVNSTLRSSHHLSAMHAKKFAAENAAATARAQAKESAKREILKHGKKATAEIRHKANAIIEKRIKKPKGGKKSKFGDLFRAGLERRRLKDGGWKTADFPDCQFTEAEKEILEVADEVVSEHDLETAMDLAREALKSEDPRVRLRAVETLTEFGEAGLPEMAEFLKDPHPDVAELAANRFELATQEIENEREIAAVAKLGMLSVEDEDQLRSMAGTLSLCNDKKTVVDALSDIIENGSAAQVAAAKEAYENETGEKWTNRKASENWLKENYVPDEDDAPDNDDAVDDDDGVSDEEDEK